MGNDLFGELADWWIANSPEDKDLPAIDILGLALLDLHIRAVDEVLIGWRVKKGWHQDSSQAYMSLGAIDLEDDKRVRTMHIAAYAAIVPPPLDLSERVAAWQRILEKLRDAGARVVPWYLVWEAMVFTYYPPHNLAEYLTVFEPSSDETMELATDLASILGGLANQCLQPLALPYHLRTDGLNVYYCGFGFDIGDTTNMQPDSLLTEFEDIVLARLPPSFGRIYNELKSQS